MDFVFTSCCSVCVELDAIFVCAASKAIFRKEQSRGNPATQSHGAAKTACRSAEENTLNTTPVFGFRTGVYLF
jgi:hypothetical protein